MSDLETIATAILARPYRPRDFIATEADWKRAAQEALDGDTSDLEWLLTQDAEFAA